MTGLPAKICEAPSLGEIWGDALQWIDPIGIGWLPVFGESLYGREYWDEYRKRDSTKMGAALTASRLSLVRKFLANGADDMVDVGIGGGAFVSSAQCFGHDVNPYALEWLGDRQWDGRAVGAMTMWDVIEHLKEPRELLDHCRKLLFVSTPIYRDRAHVLQSRHFKPREHLIYCTHEGFQFLMRGYGFEMIYHDTRESDLGRDGIGSYVFRRVV